jgi:hypothetical protein
MPVYVIVSGEYADFGVEAVALTPEARDAYIANDLDPETGYSKRGRYAYSLDVIEMEPV